MNEDIRAEIDVLKGRIVALESALAIAIAHTMVDRDQLRNFLDGLPDSGLITPTPVPAGVAEGVRIQVESILKVVALFPR